MGKKTVQALLVLAFSAFASMAAAERGTVFLTNGGQVAGELVEYVPGDHVTIDLGGNQRLSFPAAEVASVQVGTAGAAPAAEPPRVESVPVAPAPTMDPHVQQLLLRRHELTRRRIGFGGPIAMMAAGAGMSIIGWGVIFPFARDACSTFYNSNSGLYENRDCHWGPGAITGAVIGSLGIALAITGGVLIPGRIAKRRNRAREVEGIDNELRGLGFTARLEPWIQGGQNSLLGMRATLRF